MGALPNPLQVLKSPFNQRASTPATSPAPASTAHHDIAAATTSSLIPPSLSPHRLSHSLSAPFPLHFKMPYSKNEQATLPAAARRQRNNDSLPPPLSPGQWYVLVSSLVAAGTVGGVVFGWSALVVALQRDGMYADLCAAGRAGSNATSATETCDARTLAFNAIFSAGFFALVGGRLVMGVVMDLLGPRACAVSGAL